MNSARGAYIAPSDPETGFDEPFCGVENGKRKEEKRDGKGEKAKKTKQGQTPSKTSSSAIAERPRCRVG